MKKKFIVPTVEVKNINTNIICTSDIDGGIRSTAIKYGGTTSAGGITSADSKHRGTFAWD